MAGLVTESVAAGRTAPNLRSLSALLAGVAILVLGNGLQGTLLGVRAGTEGMAAETIGLIMSAYFVGYAVGSFLAPPLVEQPSRLFMRSSSTPAPGSCCAWPTVPATQA